MSNSQKVTFYANIKDFEQNIPEVLKTLTSADINILSEGFIKLISTIWQISPSRISNFTVLTCVDNKSCSTTVNTNSNTLQFSFILSDTISANDVKAGYATNDYISAYDLGPWMANTFNQSTGSISSTVAAPALNASKFIAGAKLPASLSKPPTLAKIDTTLSKTFDISSGPVDTVSADNAYPAAPAAEEAVSEAPGVDSPGVELPSSEAPGADSPAVEQAFTNVSAAKILQSFANVRPFSLLLNKHSEYFDNATSTSVNTTNTTNATNTTKTTNATSSPAPSPSSKSILDYVFTAAYLISFVGAIAFSLSEIVGYNPLDIINSKMILVYYAFTACCAVVSLFAWFNTSLWYVHPSIVNPLNVATSNPWW